jgi:hypothetical protein
MNTSSTRATLLLLPALIGTASVLTSRPALASHKAWVLKNGGADCTFFDPTNSETIYGPLTNNLTAARTAICPVALSGRWGSTDSSLFPPSRWAAAKQAFIYAYKAADFFYCYAVGQTLGGAYYFGDTAIAPTGTVGNVKLAVNTYNNWGGALESNNTMAIRSLDYVCAIPGNNATYGPTSIYGYNAKICQFSETCHDGSPSEDIISNREGTNYVQSSGFECSPQDGWDVPLVERSFDGIKNISGSTVARVVCPLPQPADDSYEHGRQVDDTRVYYKGGSTSSTCVANGTCPECYLEWYDQTFAFGQSPLFTTPSSTLGSGFVVQPSGLGSSGDPNNMYGEVQTFLRCSVPAGVTLNGITSRMSVTMVSGGT